MRPDRCDYSNLATVLPDLVVDSEIEYENELIENFQ